MFDFRVDDLEIRELKIRLDRVPAHLNKRVHLAAMKKASKPFMQELDHTTPFMYGTLVGDLRVRAGRFQKEHEHTVITGYKGGTGHVGYIGRFLEYGTKYIAERRMLRIAEERNKAKAEEIYRMEIQRKVDGLVKG